MQFDLARLVKNALKRMAYLKGEIQATTLRLGRAAKHMSQALSIGPWQWTII